MKREAYPCYHCDAIMNPTEVLYSEIYECCVQFYLCPKCGNEDEDTIL